MASPRVFTIPAATPFVPTLIRALVDGTLVSGFPAGRDPLALAAATLYLPTRRACRLARDLFLAEIGGNAAMLPRIVAIGDLDEDEIAFAQAATGALAADALDLPPALGGLERRMLLAQFVLTWAASPEMRMAEGVPLVANSPSAALALADDLARLMDDMTTRQVSWDRLDDLVPAELDAYWQLTLRFLKIARDHWPALLDQRGAIEPATRRDLLIAAEAKRLAAHTAGPVIVAGSTGSMPATAELIATIANLPHGAVVLPGLDTDLDPQSWELIGGRRDAADRELVDAAVGHPQFAMHALLRRIGIARDEVTTLGKPSLHGRERFASEALRPAAATDRWRRLIGSDFSAIADAALENLSVVEAANAEEEALAIAVALREALETPEKTAALVTPDRALARRVHAALERWKIAVSDSGGDALADTSAGVFARLAAETALGGVAPVPLLALLKHPLTRLGGPEGAKARAIATLEKAVLRGPRPQAGTGGLVCALATFRADLAKLRRGEPSDLHPSEPRARLGEAELAAAAALAEELAAALAPLEAAVRGRQPFSTFGGRHRDVIVALSRNETGAIIAFAGDDGTELLAAFDDIAESGRDLIVGSDDYAELFKTAISDRVVRRPERPGVRVHIYGLLE